MTFRKYFLILVIIFKSPAFCQDFILNDSAPVAVHERKTSPYSYPRSSSKANVSNLDGQDPMQAFSKTTAFLLFTPKDPATMEEDRAAQNYYMPSACSESKIKMDEVFHDTEGSEKLDLLIYDVRNSKDTKKASTFKTVTTPWDPTYDMSAGHETVDARMQDLARVMNPECLPARFRFVYVGSKRYQEIRYGDKAWEE